MQLVVCGLFGARLLALQRGDASFDRESVVRLLAGADDELGRVVGEAVFAREPRGLVELVDAAIAILATTALDARTPSEVLLGFYEPFLGTFDARERKARGVYYTPGELVAYVVAGVDQRLRTLSGRASGLATDVHDGEEPVFMLDPAVGSGVFLRELIRFVHMRLAARGRERGRSASQIRQAWQSYVPEQLLPRLAGLDVMPIPCALATLQVRLTLAATGYEATGHERVGVHRADALLLVEQLETTAPRSPALAALGAADVIVGNPPYARGGATRNAYWEALLEPYKQPVRAEKNLQPLADDYVRFVRVVEHLLGRKATAASGLVTSSTFLDGHLHRGMRASLCRTFPRIDVLDLGGNAKRYARGRAATRDENVFGVGQGIAVSFFTRAPDLSAAPVSHAVLRGSRASKLRQLHSPSGLTFSSLAADDSLRSFVPRARPPAEYQGLLPIDELFTASSIGAKPGDDAHLIAFEADELLPKLSTFRAELRARPELAQTEGARRLLAFAEPFLPSRVLPYAYRPFDTRFVYDDPRLWTRPVRRLRELVDGEPMLLTTRFARDGGFAHVFATRLFSDVIFLSNKTSVNCFAFPRSALSSQRLGPVERDVAFACIYALLHSSEYRARYASVLAEGFPRVALAREPLLLHALAELGQLLLAVHLGETDLSATAGPRYVSTQACPAKPSTLHLARLAAPESPVPDFVTVELDDAHRFEAVSRASWEQRVGGYQVCHKWLLDRARAGRELSRRDIERYMGIVRALDETRRLIGLLDATIADAGGLSAVLRIS